MRVVLRVLLVEFALAWALMLAGSARIAAQVWPFAATTLTAGWRDRWRVRVGMPIGISIAAGWPLLFWLGRGQDAYPGWLPAIAIPWWIFAAVFGLRFLLAKIWNI